MKRRRRRTEEGRTLTLAQLRAETDDGPAPEPEPEPAPKARRRERPDPVAQSAYLRAAIVSKLAALADVPVDRVSAVFTAYVDLAVAEQKFAGRQNLLLKDTDRLLKAMGAAKTAADE